MEREDEVKTRIDFARSISEGSLKHIGFLDQKTSIIVGINGVLLGFLYTKGVFDSHQPSPLFYAVVIALGASAVCGLLTIFPKIGRIDVEKPYQRSMIFSEAILSRKPWWWFREHWRLREQKGAFERYQIDMKSVTLDEILDQEINNAYRLAEALHRQFFWVRLSLLFLISAFGLLVILLLK